MTSFDGCYLDENAVPYAKAEKCLRVLRDGLTWSSKVTDVPRVLELRDGGHLYAGLVYEDERGEEVRLPVERAGTWERTEVVLVLDWNTPDYRVRERLTPVRKGRYREPAFERPRGRTDEVLGFMLRTELSWRGTIELEGKRTEVSFDAGKDANELCGRARRVIEKLRSGALVDVKLRLAKDVYPEYADWMRDLGRPVLPSPQALAEAMRVTTIALDDQKVTLWFGRVLGEHSILGILSDDCSEVTLSHP